MTDNDDELYKDLINFLKSNRADLRQVATEATLSTLTQQGIKAVLQLLKHGAIPALCRLVTFPGKTGHDALASLLFMTFCWNSNNNNNNEIYSSSSSSMMVVKHGKTSSFTSTSTNNNTSLDAFDALENEMIQANAIGRAMEVALSFTDLENEEERKHVYRSIALLANLTRKERGAAAFLLGGVKQLQSLEKKKNENEDENEDENEMGNEKKEEEGNDENNAKEVEVSPSVQLLLGRFFSEKYVRENSTHKNVEDYLDNDDDSDDDDDEDRPKMEDEESISTNDPYLHFASILTNITQIPAGRNFITRMNIPTTTTTTTFSSSNNGNDGNDDNDKDTNDKKTLTMTILPPLLKTLLLQLRTNSSSSPRRRRGLAATIKNCCFDTNISKLWILPLHKKKKNPSNDGDSHDSILMIPTIPTEDDMITSLLYPLAGPEEITDENDLLLLDPILYSLGPDKVREPDSKTRFHIIETLLLLCASGRSSREILRSKGAYVILKYADLVEEEEDIGEKIHECVQFLKRDEEGMKEGESDDLALQMAKERRKMQEDYDGVD